MGDPLDTNILANLEVGLVVVHGNDVAGTFVTTDEAIVENMVTARQLYELIKKSRHVTGTNAYSDNDMMGEWRPTEACWGQASHQAWRVNRCGILRNL